VKSYKHRSGEQRLWFHDDEIEALAEDELRSAGLYPTGDNPVTDLERFVQRHLGAGLDQFAALSPEILGQTEFVPGKSPVIRVNADLTGSAFEDDEPLPWAKGRWRATVAHEAGHVLLHRNLFEASAGQGELFSAGGQTSSLMRCLKRDVGHRSTTSDWREVQANKAMAALLMPRALFTQVALAHPGLHAVRANVMAGPATSEVVCELARSFEVSKQAAAIRLGTLKIIPSSSTFDFTNLAGPGLEDRWCSK
jgi:hypothetical protein